MSTFGHRSRRGPAGTTGLCAIALLSLVAGWCYPWTTMDPSEVQGSLAEDFSADVPTGYEGKYASRMETKNYTWGVAIVAPREVPLEEISEAPRDHTVFFFGEAHVYTIPAAESVQEVESDLYSRLDHYGYLPSAGERTNEATVEFTVGERRVEVLRVEETSPLGRLVRYRVPIGDERVLVALGPADRFDENAMSAILGSVRERGQQPMSKSEKTALALALIALVLIVGLKVVLSVRRGRAEKKVVRSVRL
jgi:hypothetical protein